MRVGLVIANHGAHAVENVRRWPAAAEAMGFASVWFTDHVVGLEAYKPRFGPVWAESLSSLAYTAAGTSTIRLGLGVLVAPYRNPVYAAKALATIDQLSDGRLNIGIGVGWARSEYRALGVGEVFDDRGPYTDEALDVMCRCWQGGRLGYDGRWNRFREIEFAPTPVQQPHPPLWVGGHSRPALRRAARFAAVWHPMGLSPVEMRRVGAQLDALAGRAIPRSTRIIVPAAITTDELRAQLAGFADAGCIETAVDLTTDDPAEFRRSVERLAAMVGDQHLATAG